MSNCETITNGLGVGLEKTGVTINEHDDYNEFFQYCSSNELKAVTDKFAEYGFKFLKEKSTLSRLSMRERIEYVVTAFMNKLTKRAAAIAELNNAYSAGGLRGGRALIREAINAMFASYITNFPNMRNILKLFVFDVIKGKRFVMFCDESVKLVNDVVCDLKSDKEAWGLIREASRNFVKEMKKFKEEILASDSLEFTGLISIYDDSGKLLSADAILRQYNEEYCEQLRRQIKDRVLELNHRYDEEFTESLRKGISAEKALVNLSKKYNGTLPAEVVTEAEIEKELKSSDPKALKALFQRLV